MFRSARDFGAAIREKRKALGWTQTGLAARSGTGERFVATQDGSTIDGKLR
jgi:transcriptional regulator with XRE-family HTH domain